VAGLLLVGVGAAIVRKGRFASRQSDRIAETPVSEVAALRPGTAAVEGVARADETEGTVTASLSGEPALVTTARVTAHDDVDDRGPDAEVERRVLHEDRRSVPFLVDDGTGTARVDPPREADVRLEESTVSRTSTPTAADLADRPDAAADGTVDVAGARRHGDRLRYEQGVLAPGEEVFVYGEAVERADRDGDDVEVVGGETPEQFVVSDYSREEVQSGGKIGAYVAYAFGGFAAFVGALLLLGGLSALL
jgi:hypothetical protein